MIREDNKSNISKSKNLIIQINQLRDQILSSRQVKEKLVLLLQNSGLPRAIVSDLIRNIVLETNKGAVNQYVMLENLVTSLNLLFDDTINNQQ